MLIFIVLPAMFVIFSLKCIIKQLLDEVFVICKIINVSVRVISLAFGSLITLTSTLIILHIKKTSSNNCLILLRPIYCYTCK